LWGDAGSKGEFLKIKGNGFKPSVSRLAKVLAAKHSVVMVDEFRTSRLCQHCGAILKHPKCRRKQKPGSRYCPRMFRVQYCAFCPTLGNKQRMLHRDAGSVPKIALRFIGQLFGLDIGPWTRPPQAQNLDPDPRTPNAFVPSATTKAPRTRRWPPPPPPPHKHLAVISKRLKFE